MKFNIENEYDRLEAVLVHRPGREIDRLTHENMQRFLFEDVPYLRRMQEEHDAFVQTMVDRGIQVFYLENLLLDIMRDDGARNGLLDRVCRTAQVPALMEDLSSLKFWDAEALVELLFAGITASEYTEATGKRIATEGGTDAFLLPPIPNGYFSRDPAVVVNHTAISSKMHYRERIRETLLTRAVLEDHAEFRENKIVYGGTDEPWEDRPYTIEGGDVIVLSPDAVVIGASERTRSETIEKLAGKCFQEGRTKRVYEIPIPTERAFMHLDTVFTVLDRGTVLWYPQVMESIRYVYRCEPDETTEGGVRRIKESRTFPDILRDEFDTELTVINTAGGNREFAPREQRTDGTNAFAIAPKVLITYERNERTTEALESNGITCLGIDDSELVRGLGGPRCMTMPLRRASTPAS
ncbi:MAG: arginine deiminase family protein [Phycisphaerae bacterium]